MNTKKFAALAVALWLATLTLFAMPKPGAPTNLVATAVSASQIDLTWNDNSSDETGFNVEQAPTSNGAWTIIAVKAANATSHSATGLLAGTTYWYRVRASNASGGSGYSNRDSATTTGATATATATRTATNTRTPTRTATITNTPTKTSTPTNTPPFTSTPTNTHTPTNTFTPSNTPTITNTPAATNTPTNTFTPSNTPTKTFTPTMTPTPSSDVLWARKFASIANENATAIANDSTGHIVVGGIFSGAVNFGTGTLTPGAGGDAFVAKYTADNTPVWAVKFGGTSNEQVYAVASDSVRNAYATGFTNSASVDFGGGPVTNHGGADVFLAKYSTTGAYIWGKLLGGTAADVAYDVATDSADNVYVVATFNGTVNLDGTIYTTAGGTDIFCVKYNSSGVKQWTKQIGGTLADGVPTVAVDPSNNVLIGGYFTGTINVGGSDLVSAGSGDMFIAKFNSAGTHQWSKRFGGTSNDILQRAKTDSAGNVLLVGQYIGTINFGGSNLVSYGLDDIFVAKLLGTDGSHVWSAHYGSTTRTDVGYDVATDSSNNVWITGTFAYAADFGGGTLIAQGYDVFVAKYAAADGAYISAARYGQNTSPTSAASDTGFAITVSSTDKMAIAGQFTATIDIGAAGTLTWVGSGDGFLASLGP